MIASRNKVRSAFLLCLIIGSTTLVVRVTRSQDGVRLVGRGEPNVVIPKTPEALRPVDRQVMSAATRSFQLSLEMKENVDFVLTPALQVQEIMRRGAVITYPSE